MPTHITTMLNEDSTIVVPNGSTLRILTGDEAEIAEVSIIQISRENINFYTQSTDGIQQSFIRVRKDGGLRVAEFQSNDANTGDETIVRITPVSATINQNGNGNKNIVNVAVADNFADDAAAAAGGIPVGGCYHNSGAVRIRLT